METATPLPCPGTREGHCKVGELRPSLTWQGGTPGKAHMDIKETSGTGVDIGLGTEWEGPGPSRCIAPAAGPGHAYCPLPGPAQEVVSTVGKPGCELSLPQGWTVGP